MDLSVIENDPKEVKKYLQNFVPVNYYKVLDDAYLHQIRAVLLHSVSHAELYNPVYAGLINDLTVTSGKNYATINTKLEIIVDDFSALATKTETVRAEAANANASIIEIQQASAEQNKAQASVNERLEASLDDIVVGGRNIMKNSDFSKGYRAWQEASITKHNHFIGAMHKISSTGIVGSLMGIFPLAEYQNMAMVEGTEYSISFYAYGSILLMDEIYLTSASEAPIKLPSVVISTDLSERRHITFKAPTGGGGLGLIFGATATSEDDWFSISRIKVELGNKPSDWTPAPEDIDGYINEVQSSIDTFKDVQVERNLATAQTIEKLDSRVKGNAATILEEKNTRVDQFSALSEVTTELTSKTNENEAAIKTVDLTFTDRFNSSASRLEVLEADNSLGKGKITNLESVTTTLGEVVVTQGSTLNAKLNNLTMGGRNLLRNSDFKLGADTWGTSELSYDDSIVGNLTTVTNTGTTADYFGLTPVNIFKTVTLIKDKEYVLSFYAKGNIPSINDIWITTEGELPQQLDSVAITDGISDRYSIVFIANHTTEVGSIIIGASGYAKDKWFAVAAVKLEIGNKASDWTEAPEDSKAFIHDVEANINEFKEVQVKYNEAKAKQLLDLTAKTDGNIAELSELREVTSNIEGSTATLETKLRGEYTSAISTTRSDITLATDGKIDVVKKSLREMTTDISSKADITRVDSVENNAKQSLATARTELTSSYTSAISTVKADSATYATNKANKAKTDANTYTDGQVTTLTTLVNSKADISRVDEVENNALKSLASTKTVLTSEYTSAISTSKEESASDAQNKADKALEDANSITVIKANEAQTAAEVYALAKAKAEADAALALAKGDATSKANAAKSAAIAAAALDAKNKADKALADAKIDATAKAEAAKLYAKGLVDTLTIVVNSKADITRVDKVINDSTQALAQAKVDIVGAYSLAITESSNQNSLDAQAKADKALEDATVKATQAQTAAEVYALAQANAKAAAALDSAKSDATTKANKAKADAELAAALDAKNKADEALRLAKLDATAKANAVKDMVETLTKVVDSKASISRVDTIENNANQALATAKTELVGSFTQSITESSVSGEEYARLQAEEALKQAKLDATAKASEAKSSAEIYAAAQAEAKRIEAEAYADGIVTAEEERAIEDAKLKLEQAKLDATTKANAAELAAKQAAALDATSKANKALLDAKADSNLKADAARDAAQVFATAEAEAKRVLAEAYADGIVTAEEERAIKDANDKLAAAKADATTKANAANAAAKTFATQESNRVLGLAKTDAKTKADAAKAAAQVFATAEAEAKKVLAQAYADGKITAEETRAIKDANDKLELAKADATKKSNDAKAAAIQAAAADATVKANQSLSDSQALILKAVEGIEVGGRNLLSNTSDNFKEYVLRDGSWFAEFRTNVKLIPGQTYTFSIYVEKVADDTTSIHLHIGTGPYGSYTYDVGAWRKNRMPMGELVSITYTVTEADVLNHEYFAYRLRNEKIASHIKVKYIKLEKGNKATDWSPAPEDLQSNAEKLATEAKEAAQTFATTKAEAERVKAEAYADGKVTEEELARIAEVDAKYKAALLDSTQKSEAAKNAAILAAATDAKTKADNALVSAKTEANRLSNLALDAAKVHANNKAEAERVLAEAHADGIVTIEEEERIKQANAIAEAAKLDATKKADAAKNAAVIAAAADADSKVNQAVLNSKAEAVKLSNEALAAAKVYANAQAAAERLIAEAHADNIVTVEEQARIAQALQVVKDAKADATKKADAAQDAAIKAAALDATAKANKALADAKTDSANKVAALKVIVDSKASVTSVEKVVNDANQALAAVEGKVTSAYSKAIEEIEVGGRNLIKNTTDTWQDLYFRGAHYSEFYTDIQLEPNTTYTFSFEIEKVTEGNYGLGFAVGVGPLQRQYHQDTPWATGNVFTSGNMVGNRFISTFTFTPEMLARGWYFMAWRLRNETVAFDARIRRVQFEKGNKVTNWSPAPEDVTNYIDSEVGKLNTTVDSKADINTVSKVVSDANKSLAELKTTLTGEYTKAIGTSQTASFLEAKTKADKALADAKTDATIKANAAKDAAAAFTKLEAKAKADAALALASDDATDKANAAKSAAELAAAIDAKAKADKALSDAKLDATAKANAAEKAAKDYADTKAKGLTTLISSKADIDTVNKIKNDTDGAIAKQKTDITADYSKAISDIEIGGRNLHLDSQLGGEFRPNNGSTMPMSFIRFAGYSALTPGTSIISTYSGVHIDLVPNTFYTISLEIKAEVDGINVGFINQLSTYKDVPTDRWAKIVYTFNSGNGGSSRVQGLAGTGVIGKALYVKNYKFEKGNKATDWTPAPEDVEASLDATTKLIEKESAARATAITDTLKDAKDYSNQLDDVIKGSFKNGLIDEAEAISIKAHINELNTQKNDLDQKFTSIYANTDLVGTAKTNLNSAKVALNSKYTDLVNYINSVTSNGKVTKAQSEAVSTKFTAYADALKLLSQRFEEANDSIVTKAKSDAVTSAKGYTDGVVGPLKKDVDSKASVTRVEQAEGYADKAIGESSKTITASYEKAIDDIEIGGRNLIKKTTKDFVEYVLREGTHFAEFSTYAQLEVGQTYTFSIWVEKVGEDKTNVRLDMGLGGAGGGFSRDVYAWASVSIPMGIRFSRTYTIKEADVAAGYTYFAYRLRNSLIASHIKVKMVKLEKGNKATDWTPAPEDITTAIEGTIETIKRVEATANGVKAEASSIITVGNKITGWKNLNDGTTSSFDILADSFSVGSSTTSKKPFSIVGSDIQFNGKVSFSSVVGDVPGNRITNGTLDLNKLNSTDKSLINTASSNASSALSKAGTAQSRADSAWSKAGTAETNAKTHADNALKNTIYYPNSTTIDGTKIETGTIVANKLNVNNLSALSANMGAITSGSLNINNKFIVDSSGNLTATSGKFSGDISGATGSFSGTVLADKISGTIDIESMKRSAWTPTYKVFYTSLNWNVTPSSFNREFHGSHVSYGSISVQYSDVTAIGAVMYEINLDVRNTVTVRQNIYALDDTLSIYVNGVKQGNTFTALGIYPITLPAGKCLLQFILTNTGGGFSGLTTAGDFIDNDNIKFA